MTAPVAVKKEQVADWVRQHGGQRTLQRILIASNGIAALKCIRSIRRFSYETFGTESAFHFIVMATPEDVKANAEYIHMADQLVEVPGGSNNNNYANVHLITELAISTHADAVWAGWGHASENPELADALLAAGVQWIGPTSDAMRALGDKISSSLIAQSADVKCLPWSGSGLELNYVRGQPIDQDIYRKACATSAEEAEQMAESIGFPVMIKASAGGGGKGIRNCVSIADVAASFRAVLAEVPGSPIFLMRTVTNVRHLEVQLIADEWGNAISLFGRDCSIQRRHQKIIEEGPVVAAPASRWQQMECCAVNLAKAVGYIGAGTVEYLYDEAEDEFAFLELNPRLQVEHTVTELISGVNLPAAQLQIAMGIPLHQISDIRKLFITVEPTGPIDFENCVMVRPACHVIACRITAENPDEGFQPTSGSLEDLNFRSTPHVWGYFSIGSRGGVHEFADSQFGHIFAVGSNREHARLHMSMALKELSVRGEINTTVEYLQSILETADFKNNVIHTRWLETQTQTKHVVTRPTDRNAVLLSASYIAWHVLSDARKGFLSQIERGRLVDVADTEGLQRHNVTLRYQSNKYNVIAFLTGPSTMNLRLGEYCYGPVVVRELNTSKGLLLTFEGRTYSVYGHSGRPLRVSISGQTVVFADEFDPSCVRAQMSGKLLRYVAEDGAHVEKGQILAEMEVMKMYIPVLMPADGAIHHVLAAGNNVAVGDVLVKITLDDPGSAQQGVFSDFLGPFDDGDRRSIENNCSDPEQVLVNCLDGFDLDWDSVKSAFRSFMQQLRDPLLPLRSIRSILSTLNGRLETSIFDDVMSNANQYQRKAEQKRFPWERVPEFPADKFLCILDRISSPEQRAQLAPLHALVEKHVGGSIMYSVRSADALLVRFLSVESKFASPDPSEVVIQSLLATQTPEYVANCIIAHCALPIRCRLIMLLLETLELEMWPLVQYLKPTLSGLASCSNQFAMSRISLAARRLMTRSQMLPLEERCLAVRALLEAGNPLIVTEHDITDCLFHILDSCRALQSLRLSAFQAYAQRLHPTSNLVSLISTPNNTFIAMFCNGNVVTWVPNIKMLGDVINKHVEGGICMLNICYMAESPSNSDDDDLAAYLLSCVRSSQRLLNGCRVSFAAIGSNFLPRHFTFSIDTLSMYSEERFIRGVEPSLAPLLELERLSSFKISPISAVHQSVLLFSASHPDISNLQSRLFARCVARLAAGLGDSRDSELHRNEAEAVLQDALQAIEVACGRDQYRDNHVFLNFIVHNDNNDHELVLLSLFQRYSAALTRCRVTSAEIRVELSAPESTKPMRYVCTNPTGLILLVEVYSEDEASPPNYIWHRSLQISTKGERSGQIYQTDLENDSGSLHGQSCVTPYSTQTDLDRRRRIAQSVHTLLPYDFLSLFSHALRCDDRIGDIDGSSPFSAIELCRIEESASFKAEHIDEFPSLHDHGLCAVKRPIGKNTIGMVAWLCKIYSAAQNALRDIVLIANDITHQMGSFGVDEDELFLRCSRFSRMHNMARIYIAGNSGARIGVADEVEKFIKVDWVDDCDHRKGFNYIYVDADVHDRISDSLITTPITVALAEGNSELRFRIDDIIGQKKGLGVENLAGSGSIAGETSAAYNETFTLSYVSTRSVGIGAYLVRLGQRVIQKRGGFAPIILTGFGALNKVLGSNVYKSNRQLGGSELMAGNGITHQIVADDMEGVRSILNWLEYVPFCNVTSRSNLQQRQLSTLCDPIDRPMSCEIIQELTSADPRLLLNGDHDRNIPGLFDKNSWVECLKDWARTAITGRARIGGIPVGIIAVETRSQHKITPPDPVFPESQKSLRNQPGCVLFPDSAFKVAQSIRDFTRENLPIIIMANWRGFSGGQRDMHDEVLKYGAMMVDALRECHVPVIVYLPPNSELRGGAWVVVDRNVNRNVMEMYADPSSRGGVLEPAGIIDVKFRKAKLEALISRLNPELLKDPERLSALRPVYISVAEKFADLHDTPHRMLAVGAIDGILSWENSRRFLYWRIRRRMMECTILQRTPREVLLYALNLPSTTVDIFDIDLLRMVFQRIAKKEQDFSGHAQDEQIVEWLQNSQSKIDEFLKSPRMQLKADQMLRQMDKQDKLDLYRRLQKELHQEQENLAL